MDKKNWGVHITHCCLKHGCKYNDKDCPVINSDVEQKYLCEYCDFDGIYSLDELHELSFLTREALLNKDETEKIPVSTNMLRALIFGENRSHIKFIEVDLSNNQKKIQEIVEISLKKETDISKITKNYLKNNFKDYVEKLNQLSEIEVRQVVLYLKREGK